MHWVRCALRILSGVIMKMYPRSCLYLIIGSICKEEHYTPIILARAWATVILAKDPPALRDNYIFCPLTYEILLFHANLKCIWLVVLGGWCILVVYISLYNLKCRMLASTNKALSIISTACHHPATMSEKPSDQITQRVWASDIKAAVWAVRSYNLLQS